MFNRKKRLAEDLAYERNRNTLLRQQLAGVTSECASWKWAATQTNRSHSDALITRTRERDAAVRELAETRDQLGKVRQRIADIPWERAYAEDKLAAENAAARYRHAWQSARRRARSWRVLAEARWDLMEHYEDRITRLARACARYRAELDQQQRVVDRQGQQLLDAIGYQPGERQLLGQEVTPA